MSLFVFPRRMPISIGIVGLTIGSWAALACAQFGADIANALPLNTNAVEDSGHDYAPQIKTDGAGLWLSIWRSNEDLNGETGGDFDIFMSSSTDLGETWSDPVAVNTDAGVDAYLDRGPQYVTDGNGNWVLVFHAADRSDPNGDYNTFVMSSRDNAQTWSDRQRLNVGSRKLLPDASTKPQVATDRAGNWVAVWHSFESYGEEDNQDRDLYFARSQDNGATWSAPAILNNRAETDGGDDKDPQIVASPTGTWITAWHSFEDLGGNIGNDGDILFARSVDQGRTWSSARPVNTNAQSDRGADRYVHLVTDGRGHWIVVWMSNDTLGGHIGRDQDILVARSDDDGLTWSDPYPLNANAADDEGSDEYPYAETDGQGNWVVSWKSDDELGGAASGKDNIFIARSEDHGASWTPPVPLNSDAERNRGNTHYPHQAVDPQGRWIAVWRGRGEFGQTFGDDWDVFFSTFTLPPVRAYELQVDFQLVAGTDGHFTVTNGTPDAWQNLFYSIHGLGETPIPELDVTLGLTSPVRAVRERADDSGEYRWALPIRERAEGETLWFQVAEQGRTTNIVQRKVH